MHWTEEFSMNKSRYTDNQILAILKQNEAGTSVAELCWEHDMSNASFYKSVLNSVELNGEVSLMLFDVIMDLSTLVRHLKTGQ